MNEYTQTSDLPSDDSVNTAQGKFKVIKSRKADKSEESVILNESISWLQQMIINPIVQIISSYRQAEEECAKEENQTSYSTWYKYCLCQWLKVVNHLKDLIIQIYEKYIQKAVRDKDIHLPKCTSCGYIIGRTNFDCMTQQRRITEILNSEIFGVVALIIVLILFLGLGLYHVRRYNRSFSYGTGGCRSTLLWTSFDCLVLV